MEAGCDRLGCQVNLNPVLVVAKSPSKASVLRGELQATAALTCPTPYLSPIAPTIDRRAVAVLGYIQFSALPNTGLGGFLTVLCVHVWSLQQELQVF